MQLEEERFKTRIKLLISDMNLISRKIYRCDPNQHIKGSKYN